MTNNDEHEAITVTLDYKPERRVRPFYCTKCGKCICESTGDVRSITPGFPSEGELDALGSTFVLKCNGVIYMGRDNRVRCTAKYIFN